jgi:RTA1 like protein
MGLYVRHGVILGRSHFPRRHHLPARYVWDLLPSSYRGVNLKRDQCPSLPIAHWRLSSFTATSMTCRWGDRPLCQASFLGARWISVCIACCKPWSPWQYLSLYGTYITIIFAYNCIPDVLCRTIYRVVEFVNGWDGRVISTQWVFSAWSFFSILFRIL